MQTGATTGTGIQGTGLQGTGNTGASSTPNQAELRKAAQAFEAIFLRQMIGAMRSSSLGEGVFDSSATEQFRDMADARTAEEMSKTGRFGIAELLMKQFAPKTPLTPGNAAASGPPASPVPSAAPQDEQP